MLLFIGVRTHILLHYDSWGGQPYALTCLRQSSFFAAPGNYDIPTPWLRTTITFATKTVFYRSKLTSHIMYPCIVPQMRLSCLWSGLYLNHIEILRKIFLAVFQYTILFRTEYDFNRTKNNFNLGSSCIVSTHYLMKRIIYDLCYHYFSSFNIGTVLTYWMTCRINTFSRTYLNYTIPKVNFIQLSVHRLGRFSLGCFQPRLPFDSQVLCLWATEQYILYIIIHNVYIVKSYV